MCFDSMQIELYTHLFHPSASRTIQLEKVVLRKKTENAEICLCKLIYFYFLKKKHNTPERS